MHDIQTTDKKKTIHILLNDSLLDKLNEICNEMNVNYSEIIRRVLADYYFDVFRPKVYGYMAGAKTAKGRLAKQAFKESTEGRVNSLDQWEDEEINKFLYECGFVTVEEEEEHNCKYIVETPMNGDIRGWYQYHNNGGKRLAYPLDELKSKLLKHLKTTKYNG